MYELKRSEVLKEQVKIGDEVITTELNLTKDARAIIKIVRELEIIKIALEKEKNIEENLEKMGNVTIDLIRKFFGSNADKVLRFYSDESEKDNERIVSIDNAQELLLEVVPFIMTLLPKIDNFVKDKQKSLKASIKGRKSL